MIKSKMWKIYILTNNLTRVHNFTRCIWGFPLAIDIIRGFPSRGGGVARVVQISFSSISCQYETDFDYVVH